MENIETIATGATVNTTMHHHNSSNNSNSSNSNSIDIQIVAPPPPLAAAAAPVLIDQQDDDGKKEKKKLVIRRATNQHHIDPLRTEQQQQQQQQEEDGEEAGIEITVDGCEEVSIPTKRSSDNSMTDSVAIVSKNNSPNRFPKSQGSHNYKQDPSSFTIHMTKDQPPQKSLHDSSFAATEKTAEMSHLDSSRDSLNLSFESNQSQSSNHNNMHNNIHSENNSNNNSNKKGGVSLILPNELLADALEQLTDIAMATGIVSNPSSSTDILLGRGTNPSEKKRVEKDTSLRHGKTRTISHMLQEGEEPGRIYSAANSSSGDYEEQENDGEWGEGRPFDEEPVVTKSVGGPFKSEEELSAIVRMRYYRAMGKNLPGGGEDTSDGNKKKKTRKNGMGVKSSQEIQRETMERWKNLKQEVSEQEVERMKLFGKENPSPSRVIKSKRKNNKNTKYDSSTTTASGSYSEEGDGSVDGVGLFDFSFLTRSLEEAWNQSQATLLEAMAGDGKESGESEEESYASWEEEEEEDYEETSDSGKDYRGRNQRGRRRRSGGKHWNTKEYDEDVEEEEYIDDDDDKELDSVEEHDNQDGRIGSASNRNFLEDITDNGIILVWHRPRSSTSAKLFKKVRLNIQISDTEDGNVEPNIVWEAMEDRRREYQVQSRDKISLFDISSIEKASESLNLNAFPHAVADHSILITLNDGKVCLFEAKDMEQARGIIHGLRWIAARLTFNIIIGNFHSCSEMLSINDQMGVSDYTREMFGNVTNQLVEKTLIKL